MTPAERIEMRAKECWAEAGGHGPWYALSTSGQDHWRRLARLTFQWERDVGLSAIEVTAFNYTNADSTADAETREIQTTQEFEDSYLGLLPEPTK